MYININICIHICMYVYIYIYIYTCPPPPHGLPHGGRRKTARRESPRGHLVDFRTFKGPRQGIRLHLCSNYKKYDNNNIQIYSGALWEILEIKEKSGALWEPCSLYTCLVGGEAQRARRTDVYTSYVYMYVCIYIYICIERDMYIYIYIYIYTHIFVFSLSLSTYITYMHTYIYIYIHTYIHK